MYKFRAEASEMSIDGEIDQYWGENLRYIDYDLNGAKDVKIYLNSGGGSVTEGFAIAERLRRHSENNNVEVIVSGLCASIATMIHAAGSVGSRKMTANSFYMIHNTAVMAEGGSGTLRSLADTLDKMSDKIAENYVDVIESNNKLINGSREETKAQVIAWMDRETWFTAEQALEVGLIDGIVEAKQYINPETAPAIKNIIKNCLNVPTDLMQEINNNISEEEQSLFKRFLAFLGFMPKPQDKCEDDQKPEDKNNLNNNLESEEMTEEKMIEALKAAGYTVELEAPEEKEEEMTEEEMMAALEAKGMKVKKAEAEAAANDITNEIKALREELARVKQEQKKPQVTAKTETVENLSRRERALKVFTSQNEKMLDNAAKSIKTKLNGE